MSALREAAQKVLETLYQAREFTELYDNEHAAEVNEQCHDAITVLFTALKQEEEASAWLAERKEHWRKEREKAQATKDQDPELSAALGWPGGISDPVLDRKVLLQMVAALMQDKLWEDHRVRHLWDQAQEQAAPVQMHPSQFAELIKGKETMIGVPVYWSEWPTKEKQ